MVSSLFFWFWRINGHADLPLPDDLFSQFWPSYAYEADRLRALELPFWDPYQAGGHPFVAALQPGALYPARLLLLFLDVPTAMHVSTLGTTPAHDGRLDAC